ncbi:uncharacterized protein TRIVIDRAFT_204380 [Trichoderma virens Gv29-8]|uniref:Uncharacterized protein n=1 Tax=Hypocrea virens (strain Gv29-8 / FGSC 10586) TaxID=413071 RepID=G9N2S4_HYPVG|nr:uncharacterized protein TRIVIDRAFT_204380 [Trichoderma virens Gv29-8]EHK18984.1 hypothetical protein TRIVIDRAFT_204380 [Trichoderma virens Gv29-8]UKZ56760.1 hypothetical protein TrVGV298_010601 [Trichoderma virens]
MLVPNGNTSKQLPAFSPNYTTELEPPSEASIPIEYQRSAILCINDFAAKDQMFGKLGRLFWSDLMAACFSQTMTASDCDTNGLEAIWRINIVNQALPECWQPTPNMFGSRFMAEVTVFRYPQSGLNPCICWKLRKLSPPKLQPTEPTGPMSKKQARKNRRTKTASSGASSGPRDTAGKLYNRSYKRSLPQRIRERPGLLSTWPYGMETTSEDDYARSQTWQCPQQRCRTLQNG